MTLLAPSSVEVKKHTRSFVLIKNGKPVPLADPNTSFMTEEVKQHYMGLHPELLNAKVSTVTDDKGHETITFGTVVGTKG